jgi:hypothetical protein
MRIVAACCLAGLALAAPGALAQENYESWPVLRSTFPSTGGGGIVIKGHDPVITGGKCLTTFMAVEPGADPGPSQRHRVRGGVGAGRHALAGTASGAPSTAAPPARRPTGCSSRTACSAARPAKFVWPRIEVAGFLAVGFVPPTGQDNSSP